MSQNELAAPMRKDGGSLMNFRCSCTRLVAFEMHGNADRKYKSALAATEHAA